MARKTADLLKIVPDLLYPRRCPFCHDIAPVGLEACPSCLKKLPYVGEVRCRKCGKPVDSTMVFCDDCMKTRRFFDEGRAAFRYDDLMRETIRFFKNKGRKEYGHVLGSMLYECAKDDIARWDADLILPVPLHKAKLRQRGYNQAAVIAEELSKSSGIPMRTDVLLRADRTAAMKSLDAAGRKRNLTGAFRVTEGKAALSGGCVPGAVILADDIFTTGATMDECARTLKAAGAQFVYFLTVCIGGGEETIF